MRKIEKKSEVPECLRKFIEAQQSVSPVVNLCYKEFPRKRSLLDELTKEQFGLCGYTGVPIDERIGTLVARLECVSYSNHIEHLKCQDSCKAELDTCGLEYGCCLGDDLAYGNMIAALEVRGVKDEHFGAVYKDNHNLPLWPTRDGCEARFEFREGDGSVRGLDLDAHTSVEVLYLNHETLKGWRKGAIDSFLDPNVISTREDMEAVLRAVNNPVDGKLPEFSFVIASIAKQYLKK